MQSSTKIEDPLAPPQIISQPQVPPSKEFENDCASMPVFFNLGSAEPKGSAKIVLGSTKYLKKIIHYSTTFHRSDI
jgi:hypothetical protein